MINKHIYWRGELSAAHSLKLPYESKCAALHGHNYLVEVWAYGEVNESGIIIDFTDIKKTIKRYDHINLNDMLEQPTAENLATKLIEDIKRPTLTKLRIRIWEDRDSYAEVEWKS